MHKHLLFYLSSFFGYFFIIALIKVSTPLLILSLLLTSSPNDCKTPNKFSDVNA